MDWVELELKERETADTPFKPIYAIHSGIQRIGKKAESPKKKAESPKKNGKLLKNGKIERIDVSPLNQDAKETEPEASVPLVDVRSITVTATDDSEISKMLDKIHIFLFHSVHEVRRIPL